MSDATRHQYLRAAKRKHVDAEAIYDEARRDLTPTALAHLVSVLHDRHGFKLGKADRDALIDDLLVAGVTPTKISVLIGCAARTVTRRAAEQVGSTDRLDKRGEVDKTASRDPWPILSFSASSGAVDDRPLLRVLHRGRR
jgi:hypothetical protein